ncbi:MAG: hypothetical protein E7053_02350 [Lentisphaerae bacterium]|nr:hypothetical protein [Lentisphaerota bacterium]
MNIICPKCKTNHKIKYFDGKSMKFCPECGEKFSESGAVESISKEKIQKVEKGQPSNDSRCKSQAFELLKQGKPRAALLTAVQCDDFEDGDLQYIFGRCYEHEFVFNDNELKYTKFLKKGGFRVIDDRWECNSAFYVSMFCFKESFLEAVKFYSEALYLEPAKHIVSDIYRRVKQHSLRCLLHIICWPLYCFKAMGREYDGLMGYKDNRFSVWFLSCLFFSLLPYGILGSEMGWSNLLAIGCSFLIGYVSTGIILAIMAKVHLNKMLKHRFTFCSMENCDWL